jgi:hypothetical protein
MPTASTSGRGLPAKQATLIAKRPDLGRQAETSTQDRYPWSFPVRQAEQIRALSVCSRTGITGRSRNGTIVAMGTSSLRPIPPPEEPVWPQQGLAATPENAPAEEDVLREMQRLSRLTPEEVDPEQFALMRTLWRRCITQQSVQDSGPAKELLSTGVAEEALLKVIHKAALESLIAALITLYEFDVTEKELGPSIFSFGDPTGTDGAPFNY